MIRYNLSRRAHYSFKRHVESTVSLFIFSISLVARVISLNRPPFLASSRPRERKREKGTVPDSDGIKCWWIKKKENLDEELFNEIYLFLSSKVIHTTTNTHEKSNHVSCVKHLSYPPSLIHTISYSYSFDPIASKQNRPRRREKDGWKVNESQS